MSRRIESIRSRSVGILAGALFVAGCTTQTTTVMTSDTRPMPAEPVAPPPVPDAARANRMAFFVAQKAGDTNGNGFPDQIRATVVLASHPHPTPVREDGAFVFTMYPPGQADVQGARPLAEWRVSGDAAKAAEAQAIYGPCYQFNLDLIEKKRERLPLSRVDLVCVFEPADGFDPVRSEGVRTIQIGRRMAATGR